MFCQLSPSEVLFSFYHRAFTSNVYLKNYFIYFNTLLHNTHSNKDFFFYHFIKIFFFILFLKKYFILSCSRSLFSQAKAKAKITNKPTVTTQGHCQPPPPYYHYHPPRFSNPDRSLNHKRERFNVFGVESRSNRGRTVMMS